MNSFGFREEASETRKRAQHSGQKGSHRGVGFGHPQRSRFWFRAQHGQCKPNSSSGEGGCAGPFGWVIVSESRGTPELGPGCLKDPAGHLVACRVFLLSLSSAAKALPYACPSNINASTTSECPLSDHPTLSPCRGISEGTRGSRRQEHPHRC